MYGPKDPNSASLATFGQQGQLTIHSATSPVGPLSPMADSPPRSKDLQGKKQDKSTYSKKSTVAKYIKSALDRQFKRKVTKLNEPVLRSSSRQSQTSSFQRSRHSNPVNLAILNEDSSFTIPSNRTSNDPNVTHKLLGLQPHKATTPSNISQVTERSLTAKS